ncbi:ATP-binding protein [Terasakiella sp.]|uniref:ATP-binding protein n=1 Tax=Terasakiella sp. TaxID=2034861 RepID=UPI003AA8A4DA
MCFLPAADADDGTIAAILIRETSLGIQGEKEKTLSEEILNEAIETITDGFVIYDWHDRLFICNQAYLETYKTSAPAIKKGASFESIIRYGMEKGQYPQAGDTLEARESWLKERLKKHRNPTRTVVQKTDTGAWLKIDERVTKSGMIVGVRTDITDLKDAEEKLLINQKELERQKQDLERLAQRYLLEKERAEAASKAKSEFSAIISHELRTPLTGIMGIADLLLSSDMSVEHKKFVEGLKSSSNNLLLLLNDILDYSKFEAEHIQFEYTVFDLHRLIDDLVVSLTPTIQEKGITLRYENYGTSSDVILKADKTRLRQVLLNFITNAIKFTQKGGVVIRLQQEKDDDNQTHLRFEVEDTGIGIAEDQKERLFKPFSQGDSSTTRKYGGTGLGLAISKKLVDAMDGEIGFYSVENKGSTFWFEANFEKGLLSDLSHDRLSTLEVSTEEEKTNGVKLLLAEDNDVNRKVITTVLRKMGYDIETVVNGREAYEKVQKSDFDLILTDLQMPEMDGCDAAIKIRQLPGDKGQVPIIALTADVKAEQNERYLKAGINAFISKPVEWVQLDEVIQKYKNWKK